MRRGPSVTPVFLRRYRSSLLNSTGTNGGPSLGASLQSEASMPRRSQDSGGMKRSTTAALVAGLLIWGAETARALDCPVPQAKTRQAPCRKVRRL